MNIIIVGAGEIGRYLARTLSSHRHRIKVIEESESLARDVQDHLDVGVLCGNGAAAALQAEADVGECDLFLALTGQDNTNLVAGSVAKSLGAKKVAARVHATIQHGQWVLDYRRHFGLDYLFSTERLAAVELAKHIRYRGKLVVEEIARGRIEVIQMRVSEKCELMDKPLQELNLPAQVRIAVIHRDATLLVPGGQDCLKANDMVTLFGVPNELTKLTSLLQAKPPKRAKQKVVIFGGSEYGFAIAQLLEGGPFEVRILEKDGARCRKLSELLQHTTIIQGDASSAQQLREEQIEDADFFVAASEYDEDNVMAFLQAKRLGVDHALSIIHRADYADVIDTSRGQLGLEAAISPRQATMRDLLKFVEGPRYHQIVELLGQVELVQFTVQPEAAVAGRRLAEISWPPSSALVAVLRDEEAIVPGGQVALQPDDVAFAVTLPDSRNRLAKLFS